MGKNVYIIYIRTEKELYKLADSFYRSKYRYLHLSCHGGPHSINTTLDEVDFNKVKDVFDVCLEDRRLFISACSVVNSRLASRLLPSSDCYSIMGPDIDVKFTDAAIIWASFYHLMFSNNTSSMSGSQIRKHIKGVVDLYNVPINYFYKSKELKQGYGFKKFSPVSENP